MKLNVCNYLQGFANFQGSISVLMIWQKFPFLTSWLLSVVFARILDRVWLVTV